MLSTTSSEERLDHIVHVELSQVGVLLTRADKQDRLPCLVAHGQCRANLAQTTNKRRGTVVKRKSSTFSIPGFRRAHHLKIDKQSIVLERTRSKEYSMVLWHAK